MKITVYQKPTCTTCRQVYAALREAGVDFEAVDYYTDPIPKTKLRELLRKMGIPASALLRTKEDIYKTLRLREKDLTDDQIIDLMVKHPDLIQRPIVEKGSRAILARPAERLKEILLSVLVLLIVSWPVVAHGQTNDSTTRADRRLPAVRAGGAIRVDG
jgi:arsenate reductase